MQKSDLFFFTSIVEATSTVIMEALSNSLPILCFDTYGQGEIVTHEIGRKILLESPAKSIKKFAAEIEYLYYNRQLLHQMSINCNSKRYDLSWQNKRIQISKLYQTIIQ